MDLENSTHESIRILHEQLAVTRQNLNDFFITVSAIFIFGMQAGFSIMETGLVRSKNATNIIFKSTLDAFIGATAYWLIGYAFAYGEGNQFIGWTNFALDGLPRDRYAFWFYQAIFANTASTITSGSVAERLNLPAFFIYSFLFTGVMYPIASRWAWHHNGWLKQRGFLDFGGSGVVHMLGGVCALVGTLFIGRRAGQYEDNGRGGKTKYRGHSIPITGVGAFLLMFGILGYNMSSQLDLTKPGDGFVVAISGINTLIGGCGGSLTATILNRGSPSGKYRWSYMAMINGGIAGMVSSCAGCNFMPIWAAFVTGCAAGLVFFLLRSVVHRFHVDDPLDAFPVHFGGGFTGMLATPILINQGVILTGDAHSAQVLAYQVAGVLTLIAWGTAFSSVLFGVLKVSGILRVDSSMELAGIDLLKHDEPAYPAAAWEEEQYWKHQFLTFLQLSKAHKEVYTVERKSSLDAKLALPLYMNYNPLLCRENTEANVFDLSHQPSN